MQLTEKPEKHLACVLVVDTSGSMMGERIAAANEALQTLKKELTRDNISSNRVEVAVVTFDSDVKVIQDFASADDWQPVALVADGYADIGTLGEAIEKALDILDARRQAYGRNAMSWHEFRIIIITDEDFQGDRAAVIEAAKARMKGREVGTNIALTVIVV